jgi:hypothetical protein
MRSSAYEQQESDLKQKEEKKDRKQKDEKIKKTTGNHSGHGSSNTLFRFAPESNAAEALF